MLIRLGRLFGLVIAMMTLAMGGSGGSGEARGMAAQQPKSEPTSAQKADGQAEKKPEEWRAVGLPFRPLNIASVRNRMWVCGTQESLAVSIDGGAHWDVKYGKVGGGSLLNVEFANEKFGYAAGSGGLLLMTEDGGESWKPVAGISETILQVSFADPTHGLVRTRQALMFTVDGKQWSEISAANLQGEDSKPFKDFLFTFSLAALDETHMTVVLKRGGASYYEQRLLVTTTAGKSWNLVDIPSAGFNSLVRVGGKYEGVGGEVIHKEDKGGGYGVSAAFVSADGEKWEHTSGDISLCKPDLCTICKPEGCLIENGALARIFSEKSTLAVFPVTKALTVKWAATEGNICFVGGDLECAGLKENAQTFNKDVPPLPATMTPSPLGGKVSEPPVCIQCSLDRIVVDQKLKGNYKVGLVMVIGQDGTMASVEVKDAPSDEIRDRIQRQVQDWLFEPVMRDGKAVAARVSTSVQIVVIRSK
jgi:hypothetical protein